MLDLQSVARSRVAVQVRRARLLRSCAFCMEEISFTLLERSSRQTRLCATIVLWAMERCSIDSSHAVEQA